MPCIRFGLRSKNACANVVAAGVSIDWVTSTRYLGVYFESSVRFKCSFSKNAGFYRSFNAIFGKIGRCATEEVVFALIKTKCLPVLLYGTEVCPTNAADLQSMQFTINRAIIKLFGTMSQNYYQEESNYFGINTLQELLITEVAVRCAAHAAIPVMPYALHAVHALHAVFEVALYITKSYLRNCNTLTLLPISVSVTEN